MQETQKIVLCLFSSGNEIIINETSGVMVCNAQDYEAKSSYTATLLLPMAQIVKQNSVNITDVREQLFK